mmetsp:Transcript_20955/g.54029  ORF Transcript_20955/g.54029 Transcript_20955/m.54029 type:complete len:226 (+) Transcript_20955:969-1646(+)
MGPATARGVVLGWRGTYPDHRDTRRGGAVHHLSSTDGRARLSSSGVLPWRPCASPTARYLPQGSCRPWAIMKQIGYAMVGCRTACTCTIYGCWPSAFAQGHRHTSWNRALGIGRMRQCPSPSQPPSPRSQTSSREGVIRRLHVCAKVLHQLRGGRVRGGRSNSRRRDQDWMRRVRAYRRRHRGGGRYTVGREAAGRFQRNGRGGCARGKAQRGGSNVVTTNARIG